MQARSEAAPRKPSRGTKGYPGTWKLGLYQRAPLSRTAIRAKFTRQNRTSMKALPNSASSLMPTTATRSAIRRPVTAIAHAGVRKRGLILLRNPGNSPSSAMALEKRALLRRPKWAVEARVRTATSARIP